MPLRLCCAGYAVIGSPERRRSGGGKPAGWLAGMRASLASVHGWTVDEPRSHFANSEGRKPVERRFGGGLSLGYFSLATQREVTRSPEASEKRQGCRATKERKKAKHRDRSRFHESVRSDDESKEASEKRQGCRATKERKKAKHRDRSRFHECVRCGDESKEASEKRQGCRATKVCKKAKHRDRSRFHDSMRRNDGRLCSAKRFSEPPVKSERAINRHTLRRPTRPKPPCMPRMNPTC